MKKTRIFAILLVLIMACSICAFAMGPPPDGGMGGPPPDGGGAPPADAAAAPADDAAGPATGGIAIAYAIFALCATGAAVAVPVAVKK